MNLKKIQTLSFIVSIIFYGYGLLTFRTELIEYDSCIDSVLNLTKLDLNIETKSASMIMGGDALIHSAVYGDANKGGKFDFKPMLSNIKPIIQNYDLAYYNQETILGGTSIGLSTYPCFNSPQEVGDAFLDAGFNIVSLANNHTLDRGSKAIQKSREYWNKKDVMVNGSATSIEERNNISIKEINGISYAMLSYTTTTNGIRRVNDYYVNWYTEEQVKKDVQSIRDKVDVVMVAMHWGVEYNLGVTNEQKQQAKYLSNLGVDLVIGTHPHVIEPAEYINNTFVIYSLGNFISAQRTDEQLSGLLMSITINKYIDSETGEKIISIDNPEAQFIYTYSYKTNAGRSNFKLYPYSQLNDKIFSNYKSMYQKLSKRMTSLDNRIKVKNL